jgi:hypothetical protein
MAKQAKNEMKVKTGLTAYICKWSFVTPFEEWKRETLIANLRQGLRYSIARVITNSVLTDEQSSNRNAAMIQFMTAQTGGDAAKLALMKEFCKLQGIKTEVQTEFIFSESDFENEPSDDSDES